MTGAGSSPSTETKAEVSAPSSLAPATSRPSAAEAEREIEGGREESEREAAREDQPDEALEFYRFKRAPVGEYAVPTERYVAAREHLRSMSRYSTAQERFLPSREERVNEPDESALGAWSPLGPGNVGGRTRALIFDPTNPDIMYAAAVAGGVWKTTNAGGTWVPLTDLIANIAVNSLAIDPTDPNVIYAGTGEGFQNGDAVRGAGIFKTTDGGANWTQLAATTTSDFYYVNDLVVSKNNSQRVYAATRSGVWRSTDGGANWTRVLLPSASAGCLDLVIRTDQTNDYIFAACGNLTQATVYRNTDAGGTGDWTQVLSEPGMGRTSLAIAPSNQNIIYAAAMSNEAGNYNRGLFAVFRSTSSGDSGTWGARVRNTDATKLNTILFSNPREAFLTECGRGTTTFVNQGWYDNAIAVDPVEPDRVWVGGIDLFRSDDGGANWGIASFWEAARTNPRFVHSDQHVIVFHPQYNGTTNKTLFAGNDGGIFRTDDALAATAKGPSAACDTTNGSLVWTSLNNNYAVTQFYHGLPYPNSTTYFGGTQDNGTQRGNDASGIGGWVRILSGDGGYVAIDPNDTNILYAENTGLSIAKSTDGGNTYRLATVGIANTGFMFTTPFFMDPSDSQRLWTGGQSLWRTKNGATSWIQASAPVASGSVSAIAISPTNANFTLAGTSAGNIHWTDTALTSTSSTVWPNVRPRSGYVSWVAFDPTTPNIAYATYSTFGGTHVWRSIDAGASWTGIDGAGANAIPDIPVHCIVIDPSNTARLYVGTDLGVFVSIDGGANWAVENTGFANTVVESLSLNTVGGVTTLFAFTHGRGAWRVAAGNGCSHALSPTGSSYGLAGGPGTLNVTAAPSGCAWTAASNVGWIIITSGGSGSGNGAVSFSVAPNPGGPRTGTLSVAGRTFTVTQAGNLTNVSAASFLGPTLASEEITAIFGTGLATATQAATSTSLPTTLASTTVKVRDSAGTERLAPLFFVSPGQINYLIPPGTVNGAATVTVASGDGIISIGTAQIATVAPSLFSANADGQGVAVGVVIRSSNGQAQPSEPVFQFNAAQNKYVTRPIDLGPETDQVFLVLFGTGLRNRSSLPAVTVKLGGVDGQVDFAGAQGSFVGLDQINVLIPRSLIGRGEVDVVLTVDGQVSNTVRVNIR